MESDYLGKAIFTAFCILLSAAGIYCIVDLHNQELKKAVLKQQASSSYGPFDDAMADMVGVPRRPQPKGLGLPPSQPLNLRFTNSFQTVPRSSSTPRRRSRSSGS